MIKQGYDKDFTVAVTTTSSVIGPISRRASHGLTAAMAGVSVGRMFLGEPCPLFTALQLLLLPSSPSKDSILSRRAPLAQMGHDFKGAPSCRCPSSSSAASFPASSRQRKPPRWL